MWVATGIFTYLKKRNQTITFECMKFCLKKLQSELLADLEIHIFFKINSVKTISHSIDNSGI